jgi:hypothetical protein
MIQETTFAALHRQIESLTAMVRDLACWLGHDAPKELVEDAKRVVAEWEDDDGAPNAKPTGPGGINV